MRVRDETSTVSVPRQAFAYGLMNVLSPALGSRAEADAWDPGWSRDLIEPDKPLNRKVGRRMVDVEIENYRRRLAEGEALPVNPMTKEIDRTDAYSYCSMFYRTTPVNIGTEARPNWRVTWYRHNAVSCHVPKLKPWAPDWASMATEARAGLARGFMDVLTTVSELHKTVDLIVGFKRRVKEAVLRLLRDWRRDRRQKKVSFRSISDAMTDLSSFWLEYRFGWRILYYDYLSIMRVLESLQKDVVKRSHRVTDAPETSEVSSIVYSNNSNTLRIRRTDISAHTARVGVFGSLDLRQNLQIDPINTAWELLPLSLVIDMFWNVGDVLAAYSPFSNVKEEAVWRSFDSVVFGIVDFEPNLPRNMELMYFKDKHVGISELRSYYREPLADRFEYPRPNINLSFLKALDLGAITVVLARGVLPRVLNR